MEARLEENRQSIREVSDAISRLEAAMRAVDAMSPLRDSTVRNARQAARHHLREAHDALVVALEDLETYEMEFRLNQEAGE